MQLISPFPVYYHDDLQDYHDYKILQFFRNGIEQQANCLSLIVRVKWNYESSAHTDDNKHVSLIDWRADCQWIGLRYNRGGWYWTGRDTSEFNSTLWYPGEPEENHSESCGCICMYVNDREKVLDCPCVMNQLYSICERSTLWQPYTWLQ